MSHSYQQPLGLNPAFILQMLQTAWEERAPKTIDDVILSDKIDSLEFETFMHYVAKAARVTIPPELRCDAYSYSVRQLALALRVLWDYKRESSPDGSSDGQLTSAAAG